MKYLLHVSKRYRYLCLFLLTVLLSFVFAISLPMLWQQRVSAAASANEQRQSETMAQSAESLLQDGIRLYQAERFAEAISSWNQALAGYEATPDTLSQALLLSNLSLAHQHLGQWDQASSAIANSLTLLNNADEFENSSAYLETRAKALNTQGRLHWGKGELAAAAVVWGDAAADYQQAGNERGLLKSLLNQTKALQAQGLYLQAESILKGNIYQILQNEQLEPELRATGWWHLGNAQRQFGALNKSETSLQTSLDIINAAQIETLYSSVLLDVGNTQLALAERAIAIGKSQEANDYRDAALGHYQTVAAMSSPSMTQLQAKLNQLSVLITSERWAEAETLWPTLTPQITQLSPSRTAVYTQLNFAKSLTHILKAEIEQKSIGNDETIATTGKTIDDILVKATSQAKELTDPIAESYGVGQRGELYEIIGQFSKAQQLTQTALQLTDANQYPDGRYQWEWQLGRLLKQQGKPEAAIQTYKIAVNTLESVRENLLFTNTDIQFSFRDNVEPVYRELVELLLGQSKSDEQALELAIKQIDNLQLSELENFLRCDLAATTAISQFEANNDTAIIYPIILKERLAVILQLQDQKIVTSFLVDKTTAEATLEQLRKDLSLSRSRTPEVLETAKEVYKWIIQDIEPQLQQYHIKTLVFVLDGMLRNIPMGVLHDGEHYLLEKYAIAIAPELELFTPRPLSKDLTVFTGGVGTAQQIGERRFPAIEKLADELDEISRLYGATPPLTNENFKKETLQQQLSTGQFSGIHIKTHGVFSSDPEETFIVAHEHLIRGQELGELIQVASQEEAIPVELLVLSSCSTATGDNRAVLGLAGIAVRAGARSTVSTLWEAQDTPNTELMIQFYNELKKPETTRTQALRNAQLALLNRPGYTAPHIWATYVLVGNWQ
ncbi:MAG: CHAT domain-containing protein [Cyanobacteria bacterium P01_H01_bin.21]